MPGLYVLKKISDEDPADQRQLKVTCMLSCRHFRNGPVLNEDLYVTVLILNMRNCVPDPMKFTCPVDLPVVFIRVQTS
ncbi:uncharacterized protein LOC143222868 isoform X3 [Tachypleus tridentatus]|uniref:uncharacterized protein LOC143222868 isoform X3 n=1 Tax=Tachypleus tridentatus TaxID=6853 RepID=UPI003FD5F228